MEARQIQCDNLGMSRDQAVSALGKDKNGATNFAFENHNIRILANGDNTALAVTNEKSTKAELTGTSAIPGVFIGGCKLNKYLVLFIKNTNPASSLKPDSIYRIHYDGITLRKVLLYNGDLNFDLWHPIEAIGYYESEEVQKVYWVDGYNPNRFINIAKVLYEINGTTYNSRSIEDIVLSDGTLHALCSDNGIIHYYYHISNGVTTVWAKGDVDNALYPNNPSNAVTNIAGLKATIGTTYSMTISGQGLYDGKLNPFDFQGAISKIPVATISKNYSEAGTFQAGVIQYFFTYYNKYGIETPIIWNSDLQYISMQDRGAKQDESVACGFDFEIQATSLDKDNYEYLRIYSCYRSSINVTAGARLVTEVALKDLDFSTTPVLYYADLGVSGETVNAADLKYLGGQNIIADTLDYKQDTLFLGNLKTPASLVNTYTPTMVATQIPVPTGPRVTIKRTKYQELDENISAYVDVYAYYKTVDDEAETISSQAEFEVAALANGVSPSDIPTNDVVSYTYIPDGYAIIQECPGISWVYKLVSDHKPEGVYSYKPEISNSQEEIAGFKWREVYRFGIQFMTPTGEWTSAQWVGDKYCDLPPMNIAKIPMTVYDPATQKDIEIMGLEEDGLVPKKIEASETRPDTHVIVEPVVNLELRAPRRATGLGANSSMITIDFEKTNPDYRAAAPDAHGIYHLANYMGKSGFDFGILYTADGYYMATAVVDLAQIFPNDLNGLKKKYIGYRLLMADMDLSNRRIVEQGIINPTMFNYNDRYYNRPYCIPSWIFRPRKSKIVNRHFDTLANETAENGELQGIISRRLPGWDDSLVNEGSYNSYMFLISANDGGSYMQWKLIYYNSAHKVPTEDASNNKTAFGQWLEEKSFPYSTYTERMLANLAYMTEASKATIEGGGNYNITALFEDDYMVVSSGKIKKAAGKWDSVAGEFLSTLVSNIKSKKDPQGNELPLVFSSSMLPDGGLLKDIAFCKGDAALIWAIIGLVIAAVAAAVASVFTAGASAAAAGVACGAVAAMVGTVSATVGTVCAALTPIIACAAVAGASGAAAIAQNMDQFQEVDRRMMSKGFFPVNTNHGLTGENNRTDTGYKIKALIDAFFTTTPCTWDTSYSMLLDDPDSPFMHKSSTRGDSIGMDWNAYVAGGALRFTSAEEEDLKRKANLFCVDESVVTLNAPDIEDIANAVENSDAYDLQLVGMVPVHSAYGIYDIQCTQGLASAAEVLRNRSVVPGSVPTTDVLGLMNGDFYQDSDITEAQIVGCLEPSGEGWTFDKKPIAVPSVALYRQWMWNRDTSIGMWLPGIPMQDALEQDVLIPPSQPTGKIFANMRYSFNTEYQDPFRMTINSPKVCLDEQVMLKSFMRAGSEKFYYENVNTISTNYEDYYLVKNRQPYPKAVPKQEGEEPIPLQTIAALHDPVQIKFKETPHVLIPIKDHDGVTHILPYTGDEESVSPFKLYGDSTLFGDNTYEITREEDGETVTEERTLLGNAILEGVRTNMPVSSNTFRYIRTITPPTGSSSPFTGTEDLVYTMMHKANNFQFHSTTGADGGWIDISGNNKAKDALISCFNTELCFCFDDLYADDSTTFNKIAAYSLLELAAHNIFYKTKPENNRVDSYHYLINSNDVAVYELDVVGTQVNYQTDTPPTVRIRQLTGNRNPSYNFTVADKVYIQKYPIIGCGFTAFSVPVIGSKSPYYYLDKETGWQSPQFVTAGDMPSVSVFSFTGMTAAQAILKYSWYHAAIMELTGNKLTDGGTTYLIGDAIDENSTFTVAKDENIENYFGDTKRFQTWDQEYLSNWGASGYPYLFMGELVKKIFNYNTWMGGTQKYALKQLHWNVASPITKMDSIIASSWGDTYYQRWDCQKTYPFTEDDKNGVVEVLSFMLESHQNLDGRSDVNRGIVNLLNIRPTNTMFNPVYGQKDNFFNYSILDEKFENNSFEADVAWSLTKNNMSDVDSWTSIMAVNQMSMEGRLGAVRKILNMGDALVVFQDTGMSMIKYNEEVALASTEGLPVQLGNTGKVNGYRIISDTIGCHNKFSINKNSAGVFFTDDYNKAFMQYSQTGGIKDIGQEARFSQWFKDNITGSMWTPRSRDAFRTSYDEVTHDLYIITNKSLAAQGCLVYNTLLQKFTSFMSYVDTPIITRLNSEDGKSGTFAIRQVESPTTRVEGWQLFVGNGYNSIYGNPVPYSMEYRINPDPMHDSIFTNYQYTADWLEPNSAADQAYGFGVQNTNTSARNPAATLTRRYTTFDTVEAWNEFQYGKKRVDTGRVGRFPVKSKFRIWRGDIPRDGENIGRKIFAPDRMRNPWIHLKFEKLASTDDSKMVFHNLAVNYYNQYGRI